MTIQYPGKLSKDRTVYFALDNVFTYGNNPPTAADLKIKNTIYNKLVEAGLKVKYTGMGADRLHKNIEACYYAGETNAIIFNVMNGVDPTNIREISYSGYDNVGTKTRNRGNDAVLGWMYHACDCVHPDGKCYDHVLKSESSGYMGDDVSPYLGPHKYMEKYKIYGLCTSDDQRRRSNPDLTGERLAEEFIALFEGMDGTSSSTSSTSSDSETSTDSNISAADSTKTLSKEVKEVTSTKAYYQQVFTTKTDENGAFQLDVKLPYPGKYICDINYPGSNDFSSCTKSILINNQRGKLFEEKVLQTVVNRQYTDGTNETSTDGSTGSEAHTRTVTTTTTYKDGNVEKVTETVVDNDTHSSATKNITDTTSTTSNVSTSTGDTDPFTTIVTPNNNSVPNVAKMKTGTHGYEMVDLNKSYTLRSEHYLEVMERDSKTMQLHNYTMSKYTAFLCEETNNYVVLERERWNSIEESIHVYMTAMQGPRIFNNTTNIPVVAWPKVKVDFQNKRSIFNNTKKLNWKNTSTGKCTMWFCADYQNYGRDCGPTATSMTTQFLHHFQGERVTTAGAGTRSDTGPADLIRALQKANLTGTQYSDKGMATALPWLKAGKPVIGHVSDHYLCLAGANSNNMILVCNSVSNSDYGPLTGWHSLSTVSGRIGGRSGVLVQCNWTIDDAEKTKLQKFYSSMGGKWERVYDTNEKPAMVYLYTRNAYNKFVSDETGVRSNMSIWYS